MLSKQFLVSCTQSSDCAGGYQRYAAIKALTGVPLESDYPYQSAKSGTITPFIPGICLAKNKIKMASTTTYRRYRQIPYSKMRLLVARGPVMASFAASGDFALYKRGIFMCQPVRASAINHAINVIGYTDLNGTIGGHWIVKNSWGPDWGIGGFAYISKYHDCGLKYDVYQFVDSSVATTINKGGQRGLIGLALLLLIMLSGCL